MRTGGDRAITGRLFQVWRRNWTVYCHTWPISFLPPLLEPILYVAAFGIGLAALVGTVSDQGRQVTYLQFIAPALVAMSIMYSAFFENTYASFVRMYYHKTFDAIVSTPVSVEEVITGEIVWGATRSLLASTLMVAVLSLFGLIRYPHGLLILPVALLGGGAFGATAMLITSLMKNIDMFNLPTFLFITPMFLFSGTFFPLDVLPAWAQYVALSLPLTHLVQLTRACAFGRLDPGLLWHVLYLGVLAAGTFRLALRTMRRRLVK
jgi:lipooligosaccharide transport system permease protein